MANLLRKTLNLFFPQWQGSGRIELYEGAKLLYQSLQSRISFTEISTYMTYSLAVDENIIGYNQIFSQFLDALRVIQTHNPERILTVGGDCGIEIAPVSFLNKKYDQALAVIWLDAHGDLNTPNSSLSACFHGMPLRTLLGEGDVNIVNRAFSKVYSDQVFLVGAREFDSPEEIFIQQKELSVFSAQAINTGNYKHLFSALEKAGFDKIYIHLDLDVIEPKEFPHVACPTPDGIRIDRLRDLLVGLRCNFDVVGFSILEFLPTDPKNSAVLEVVKLLDNTELLLLATL